jgi:chromosomal replication initiation ATPase DnaA
MMKKAACRPCFYQPLGYDFKEIITPAYLSNPEFIIAVTCATLNIRRYEMLGKSRAVRVVDARRIAIKLIRTLYPEMSFKAIGKLFDRDHSTMMYSCDVFDELIATDKLFIKKYATVYNELIGGANA